MRHADEMDGWMDGSMDGMGGWMDQWVGLVEGADGLLVLQIQRER